MNADSPGSAYRLFSLFLLPFWLLHAIWHGRSYGLSDYLKFRLLGFKSSSQAAKIWVHAASVGEVVAISPLVDALLARGESVLFTSFTASGYQTIGRNFPGTVEAGVIPIDFFITCRAFLRRHNIKLCLLMETELWPELLYQTAKRKIPIIQVNARLSAKTAEAPIFVRYILRRSLSAISLYLARNELDRQLLIGLGAEQDRVKVVGNLKSRLDQESDFERLVARDYLLLASSHEGEEQLFLQHQPENNNQQLIVIAPRHPARSATIQQLLSKSGLNFAVRSKAEAVDSKTQVYLADTLGELKALMAYASIVVMGGSFDQTGGHNLIEPANLGCAIITGPSDNNIKADIIQLGDSIIQVNNMQNCWQQIELLLADPLRRKKLGEMAREKIGNQSDIVEIYLNEIKPYL